MNRMTDDSILIGGGGRRNLRGQIAKPADSNTTVTMRNGGMRFIDLFAGIGGFRLAFESLGLQCVFSSEWDRFARKTYSANFGDEPTGDIREVASTDIPNFDVLTAGFPCQAFSIAGVSKKNALGRAHGFLDKTQGTLFFEVARILRDRRPKAFVLENVKNLVYHDGGRTFEIIRRTLADELGYYMDYRILNAAKVLPQNRERIFLVGFRDKAAARTFRFPELAREREPRIADILEEKFDERYVLSDRLWNYLQAYKEKHRKAGHGFGFGMVEPDGIARTLSARYYKDGSEILVPVKNSNPRRLTPRECARLMGFPEDYDIVVSDTQAYKQFGNAVAVPVAQAVAFGVMEALIGRENVQKTPLQTRGQVKSSSRNVSEKSAKGSKGKAKSSGSRRRKIA